MFQESNNIDINIAIKKQHAFWVNIVLFGITSVSSMAVLYFGLQTNDWQHWISFGLLVIYGLVVIGSMWLSRHGQVELGIILVIAGMMVGSLIIPTYIGGAGLSIAIVLVVLIPIIATWTLSSDQATTVTFLAILAAVVTLLIDLYSFPYRRLSSDIESVSVIIIILFAFSFGIYAVWHFTHYDLRTKFVLIFVTVSITSLGIVTVYSDRMIENNLMAGTGTTLANIADSHASSIGGLLANQVDMLKILALNEVLHESMYVVNEAYPSDTQAQKAQLKAIDKEWLVVPDSSSLIQNHLTNGVASYLKQFRKQFPNHVEVFVTDKYGGLVATTNRTTDYDQSDEIWWQKTYYDGLGKIYLGQPKFDDSSLTIGLDIAIPIYHHATREVIGVLHSTYGLSEITQILDSIKVANTFILLPNYQLLTSRKSFRETYGTDILTEIRETQFDKYAEFSFGGERNLLSKSQIKNLDNETNVTDLQWNFVVYQSLNETLSVAVNQERDLALIAITIAGVIALIAMFASQKLTTPIVKLTQTIESIIIGNFDTRADVQSTDEIGTLAFTFNQMNDQLQKEIASLEEQVAIQQNQMEIILNFNQRLSGIFNQEALLKEVVSMTQRTFDYYHVQIYLLDEQKQNLMLVEGYGLIGVKMRKQRHHIPLATVGNIVAHVARHGRLIKIDDLSKASEWEHNPLLLNAHSEIAVPIILEDEVVGVLDVYSDEIGGLGADDDTILQVLVNQIATAVYNNRLLEKNQKSLEESQQLQQLYTGQVWEKFTREQKQTTFQTHQPTISPLIDLNTPEVNIALQERKRVNLTLASDSERQLNVLAVPLKLRNEIIGVLGIRDEDTERRWTEDEFALIDTVCEQMTLAIENARLFEETGRRAGREKVIADATQQVWASGNLEKVMQTTVSQLGSILNASKVVIHLGTAKELSSYSNKEGQNVQINIKKS